MRERNQAEVVDVLASTRDIAAPPLSEQDPPRLAQVIPLKPMPTGLVALVVEAFDEDTGRITLRWGRESLTAPLDAALSPVVVLGAIERKERLIVQREAEGWVVLGALRTCPTPGVDHGDEYVIAARRVTLRGTHELSLVAGASSFVLRALGQMELLAKNITTRAEGVQKIVGRIIHLN